MKIEQIGGRLYVTDAPYALKDRLKAAGCHWDSERRAWWAGVAKRPALEAIVSAPAPTREQDDAARLERDRNHILGRATYAGESGKPGSYYLVGEGKGDRGPWCRLLFRDGSRTFFADAGKVKVTTRYQEPRTLRGLQEFAARKARERETGECFCSCHRSPRCVCPRSVCPIHFDGCDRCGCENDG